MGIIAVVLMLIETIDVRLLQLIVAQRRGLLDLHNFID